MAAILWLLRYILEPIGVGLTGGVLAAFIVGWLEGRPAQRDGASDGTPPSEGPTA